MGDQPRAKDGRFDFGKGGNSHKAYIDGRAGAGGRVGAYTGDPDSEGGGWGGSSTSGEINSAFWDDMSTPDGTAEGRALQKDVQNAPALPKGTVVYRGQSGNEFDASEFQSSRKGTVLQMDGMQSTSLDSKTATRFTEKGGPQVMFEISRPKGLSISSHSRFPKENEVLLPHGAKYRVTGKRTVGDTTFVSMNQLDKGVRF